MSETTQGQPFTGWALLELMGHRRLAGWLSEHEFAGQAFIRLDVPGENGEMVASQLYSAAAVYAITPTTEEIARGVAAGNRPAPVQRWELPSPKGEGRQCRRCGGKLVESEDGLGGLYCPDCDG